jgi:hypothetical protein
MLQHLVVVHTPQTVRAMSHVMQSSNCTPRDCKFYLWFSSLSVNFIAFQCCIMKNIIFISVLYGTGFVLFHLLKQPFIFPIVCSFWISTSCAKVHKQCCVFPWNVSLNPYSFLLYQQVVICMAFITVVPPKETLLACACFNHAARVDFNFSCHKCFSDIWSLEKWPTQNTIFFLLLYSVLH